MGQCVFLRVVSSDVLQCSFIGFAPFRRLSVTWVKTRRRICQFCVYLMSSKGEEGRAQT